MILFENIRLGMQSLRANPLRSALTLIGIAVGIAAVLYVVVLGEITKQRINEQLESLGSNVLSIRPGFGRHSIRGELEDAVVNNTTTHRRHIGTYQGKNTPRRGSLTSCRG